jgi:putative intracellular protease/amidase
VPFYVNDALKTAGRELSISDQRIFHSFVVEDRELITGQNPPGDREIAGHLVKALDRATCGGG